MTQQARQGLRRSRWRRNLHDQRSRRACTEPSNLRRVATQTSRSNRW
jgi:hypothetical protein